MTKSGLVLVSLFSSVLSQSYLTEQPAGAYCTENSQCASLECFEIENKCIGSSQWVYWVLSTLLILMCVGCWVMRIRRIKARKERKRLAAQEELIHHQQEHVDVVVVK